MKVTDEICVNSFITLVLEASFHNKTRDPKSFRTRWMNLAQKN